MGDKEGRFGLMDLFIIGETFCYDCQMNGVGGFAFYAGDGYGLKGDADGEDLELAISIGVWVVCYCYIVDGVFELTASFIVGEYKREEGGGCHIFPMVVFSELFNGHVASKADVAAEGVCVFH